MRRRLLVAQLLVVATVLLVLELPLAIVYSRHEHDALRAGLQRDAAALAAVVDEIGGSLAGIDIDALIDRFTSRPDEGVVIVDATGAVLTQPSVLSEDREFVEELDAARAGRTRTGEIGGLIVVAVPVGSAGESSGAVLVARSDESVDRRVRRVAALLGGIALAVLGVTAAVGLRLSRWVVDPLRRLDDRAHALGRGDLGAHADTHAGPPEIVALATTFNEMAERLDELVTSQRRFVADASHQLRTPLTALRLRLENLAAESPADAATQQAALAETARLTRLVDGLLALARAEGRRPERELVAVDDVLAERQEAWAPLAAEQGITLRLAATRGGVDSSVGRARAGCITAAIVPGHLEQIVDNLVNNALDASRPGQSVEMATVRRGDTVEIHVIDEGPGLTDDERSRAFDPFWRSPRVEGHEGTGLGLAIVAQLARASGGSVGLERSASGGIDAVVRFPSAG